MLLATSATPDFFTDLDLRFVETVARWVGLVADRAAHIQCLVEAAAKQVAALAVEEAIGVLTARQQEVAGLDAQSLTN